VVCVRFNPNFYPRSKLKREPADFPFDLPYRLIYAVCSQDAVAVYDTVSMHPIAFVKDTHYAPLTDIAWSPDGSHLIAASIDGYCTQIEFEADELGAALSLKDLEGIEDSLLLKGVLTGQGAVLIEPLEGRPHLASDNAAGSANDPGCASSLMDIDNLLLLESSSTGHCDAALPTDASKAAKKRVAPQLIRPL
jgi:hypothetical protein